MIEVGITSQERLQAVETEKKMKYDLLAKELSLIHKIETTRIIPWVMTWDGIVTNFHNEYLSQLKIPPAIEAYIQSIVLKTTLESVSFDYRRGNLDRKEEEQEITTIRAWKTEESKAEGDEVVKENQQ